MLVWRPSKRVKLVALAAGVAVAASGTTLAVATMLLPHPLAVSAPSSSGPATAKIGPGYTAPAVDESEPSTRPIVPSEAPVDPAPSAAEPPAVPPPAPPKTAAPAVPAVPAVPILCPTGGILLNLVSASSTANTNEVLTGSWYGAVNISARWTVTNQSASAISLIGPDVMAVTGSLDLGISTGGAAVPGTLAPKQTTSVYSSGLASTAEWSRMTGWAFKSIGSYPVYIGANPACAQPPISVATEWIDKGGLVVP